jgi:hypothetical protein
MKRSVVAVMMIAAVALAGAALQAQTFIGILRPGALPRSEEASQAAAPVSNGGGCASGYCPSCKICVIEPKKHTKNVFNIKYEEFCVPRCSLLGILRGGCCQCAGQECGDVHIRRKLVVKKVPDCDTKQCVLRDRPPCVREATPASVIQPKR